MLERGLAVELDDHLGFATSNVAGCGSPSSPNGFMPKTLATQAGPVPLEVPQG